MITQTKPQIFVGADGLLKFIYDDELAELLSLGRHEVTRASHVEPSDLCGETVWTADMSPSGGTLLGPFPRRQEALAAEIDWLNARMGNT